MNTHRCRQFRPFAALVSLCATGLAVPAAQADTILVDAAQASGLPFQDGTTWDKSFKSLQSALAVAVAGDDIWLAAGTYKPTTFTDRNLSFELKAGVRILGGFAVGDVILEQRDPLNNVTILSGDIGALNNPSDNSFHVLHSSNSVGANAVLSGVVVTAGK